MNRYSVTNVDENVTFHVWAFDEEHALEKVEKLTDSNEFKKVKHVDTNELADSSNLVNVVFE